jgi:hypothetical protein
MTSKTDFRFSFVIPDENVYPEMNAISTINAKTALSGSIGD